MNIYSLGIEICHPAHFTKLKADVNQIIKNTYLHLPSNSPPYLSKDFLPEPLAIKLTEELVKVLAFRYKGDYYIKLRDLRCDQLIIDYDISQHLPTLTFK